MLAAAQGFRGSAESIAKQELPRLAHKCLDSQRKRVQPGVPNFSQFIVS